MSVKCICVICLTSHQIPSLAILLPQTVFVVISMHSSAPVPRSTAGAGHISVFPISLVLNLHDSLKTLARLSRFLLSSFLLLSFSQLAPSFPLMSCTAALPGALGLYEHP